MEVIKSSNNEKIAIITDSCADVSKEYQEQYGVYVLPLMIRCQDGEYRDGVDITADDIYERLKTELPKTSTPTGVAIEELLEQIKEEGYDKAVAIMLSGGISGTANHLRLAVEDADIEVYVIDSLTGSVGCGACAIQAAMWRNEGMAYAELCAKADKLCKASEVFFSIDTLEYLEKGGRIGKVTALLGNALNIKPVLAFAEDGELCSVAKVRGRKAVEKKLLSLVEEYSKLPENAGRQYNIFVADGGAEEERDSVEAKMKEMFPNYNHIFRAKIGATLATYVGPGLLGAGIQFLDE